MGIFDLFRNKPDYEIHGVTFAGIYGDGRTPAPLEYCNFVKHVSSYLHVMLDITVNRPVPFKWYVMLYDPNDKLILFDEEWDGYSYLHEGTLPAKTGRYSFPLPGIGNHDAGIRFNISGTYEYYIYDEDCKTVLASGKFSVVRPASIVQAPVRTSNKPAAVRTSGSGASGRSAVPASAVKTGSYFDRLKEKALVDMISLTVHFGDVPEKITVHTKSKEWYQSRVRSLNERVFHNNAKPEELKPIIQPYLGRERNKSVLLVAAKFLYYGTDDLYLYTVVRDNLFKVIDLDNKQLLHPFHHTYSKRIENDVIYHCGAVSGIEWSSGGKHLTGPYSFELYTYCKGKLVCLAAVKVNLA